MQHAGKWWSCRKWWGELNKEEGEEECRGEDRMNK